MSKSIPSSLSQSSSPSFSPSTSELVGFVDSLKKPIQEIILTHYGKNGNIFTKEDKTPVTEADRAVENFLRKQILEKFPDHGFLGEETGTTKEGAEFIWVVDPIDGTKSFIGEAPLFGSLIALLKKTDTAESPKNPLEIGPESVERKEKHSDGYGLNDREPVFGALYLPVQGDILMGDNSICLHNGSNLKMETNLALEDCILLTTDIRDIQKHQNWDGFNNLLGKVRYARTWGDCFGYYQLVTGKAHIMIDPIMSAWDTMALIPIIRGAGGIITDYYGDDPMEGKSVVAAISGIHRDVIDILN